MDKYQEAMEALLRFRDERDWAQFHDSKNLALALLLEASELNELFFIIGKTKCAVFENEMYKF